MLIPRQLQQHSSLGKISVKNFNDSGLEVKPIYKKMPQHSHVNKLLHTAAAGNGVLEDVDGLLTPIQGATHTRRQEQPSPQQDNSSASSKERTERNLWRNDEVLEMMFVMQQTKALDKLNDKQMKSENVFKEVELVMRKNGYVKKSHLQIWTKWKFLKSTYMTSRRNGIVPRMIPREIYTELHQMVSGASECDTSTNGSINGDNSNANGGGALGTSGVEADSLPNAEEDDSFGMAHPIFGFRLGSVKNEPIDNGYDTVENNDSVTVNNLLEEISPPKAKADEQKSEKEKPIEKVVVPHRGRGRPPKKLPWAASTPNTTPTSTPAGANMQLPPLRVAPFAKATNAANALASRRPPPPLTRPIRVTNISNISDNNKTENRPLRLIQPKLLPKPQPQPQPTQTQSTQAIRFQNDIGVQSGRASTSPSPSYPKLKQVPIRKTPYSLRPDRAIPDLDESFSPPPAPEKQRKLEEVPSTSHLVMQSHGSNGLLENGNTRKRHIELRFQPIPTKLRKIPSDDDEPQMTDGERSRRDEHTYGQLMQTAIVDLSASLRKTQTQMMKEFFNKQHELLEKEHAFQMQQDRLIMETFHMQTQEIMGSVRDLVATIASDKREEQRRLASRKRTAKLRRLQNSQKEKSLFANEESSQGMHELRMSGQATEMEQNNVGKQKQMEEETEEMYTDEEELTTMPDHNRNEGNANLEEEIHNVFEAVDRNQQDDQPLVDQTSSPLAQHQSEGNVEEEDDDDEDDEDDDDDDEDEDEDEDDDDDDDDDEDSDSDDDDDDNDDNGSSQLVTGDDDDHGHVLPNMVSAVSVVE